MTKIAADLKSEDSVETTSYRDENGTISVETYRDDNGLLVALHDCRTSKYSDSTNNKQFNGLVINAYILGSAWRASENFTGERLAGYGSIARPWPSHVEFKSSAKHVLSVDIVVLMNNFKLKNHEEHSDMVIQHLLEKYRSDQQFKMSDLSMAYCYGICRLFFENRVEENKDMLTELVSGLLLELYSKEQEFSVSEPHEGHTVADNIFADMLSTPMHIDTECLDRIYEENGVNSYKAIRLFKQRYGTTPYAYFRRTRLQMAAAALLTGDRNIQKVATMVGYVSGSKFAIAFKKQFGIRPKHFLDSIEKS